MITDRIFRIAALGILITGTCWAQDQPSLGDVARNKPAAKAKVVVTDDDLPAHPVVPPATLTTPQSASEQANPAAEPNSTSTNSKDALAEAQSQLQKVKVMEQQELRIIDDFEKKIADPNVPESRREIYRETLEKAKSLLDDAQRQRQALEAQLARQQKIAEQKQAAEKSEQQESDTPSPQ